MPRQLTLFALATVVALMMTTPATAQAPYDPVATMKAQREAMKKFDFLDGLWRGPATTTLPTGGKLEMTQTERVGSFLGGTVKLIEGRGYDADGNPAFNALGIISYDVAEGTYNFRSYAQGYVGDFEIELTDDGFAWEIPAGPMTIKYKATIKDGTWHEVGDRVIPGQEPVRFVEFTVKRFGDTNWPASDQVQPE